MRPATFGPLALVLLAGCAAAPAPTAADTGARAAVQDFYEALTARDWARAYGALHPESQGWCDRDRFARLGQQYVARLGFSPEAVRVRGCEEHGEEALAHVTLTGPGHTFKDGISLRRTPAGWRVVLPRQFGQRAGR